MIRPCGGCGTPINDRHDARYTIRGDNNWYCSIRCVK